MATQEVGFHCAAVFSVAAGLDAGSDFAVEARLEGGRGMGSPEPLFPHPSLPDARHGNFKFKNN